jgi:hypothetical protein
MNEVALEALVRLSKVFTALKWGVGVKRDIRVKIDHVASG